MTTGKGNKPLTKDEQIVNIKGLCVELNNENIRLKEEVKRLIKLIENRYDISKTKL